MFEELLVRCCSPTLAGLKTGNLFSCAYQAEDEVISYIRFLNRILLYKGIRVLPLKYNQNRVLIYLYRPGKLKLDLSNPKATQILQQCGYCCQNPEACIAQLSRRLYSSEEFPHEIGLFLSYPPEDVFGFMQNRGSHCKCTGYWKVYGDVEAAQKCFAKYKKCTDIYCAQWAKGQSIERLTVAV